MKKPMFKARIGWAIDKTLLGGGWIAAKKKLTSATHRICVTDARELTAEKAVEKALQSLFNAGVIAELLFNAARRAGMVADVTIESRVRVRRAKP